MLALDKTQTLAAESREKTVIVSGEPGTGKTLLVVRRFAHLVKIERVPASSILILAFSPSSVRSLRRMIEETVPGDYGDLWIHTYYSFAARILSEYASLSGQFSSSHLTTPFREYLMVKEMLRTIRPDLKSRLKHVASRDGLAQELSDFFGLLKQNLVWPAGFEKISGNLSAEVLDVARMYSTHESQMRESGWVGMKDVTASVVRILQSNSELLEQYRDRFAHILIDEFEEIDSAQLDLVRLLVSDQSSLFLAGDEKERIYRFRGSMVEQFSEIIKWRKGTQLVTLDKNYRLASIHERASRNLIGSSRATTNEPAGLMTGGTLRVLKHEDVIEQAYAVARDIKCRLLGGAESPRRLAYSDFAVICRSISQSALPLEEAFSYYGIPYVLYNATNFYKHPMVRCIADFLRLLSDPDDDEALLRLLRAPFFKLNPIELSRLATVRQFAVGESLYSDLLRLYDDETCTGREISDQQALEALKEFLEYFEKVRKESLKSRCPSAVVHSIMRKMFFQEIIEEDDIQGGMRDAQNLRFLHEVVTDIEDVFANLRGSCRLADIAEYMEHAFAYFSSQQENSPADETGDGVRIMTVHQAKGLEFSFVYLVDMTDEFYPSLDENTCLFDGKMLGRLGAAIKKSRASGGSPAYTTPFVLALQDRLQEERQLAYVAITRARESLTICYTEESHFSEPIRPSPFLEELMGDSVDIESSMAGSGETVAAPCVSLSLALNRQEIESALRSCVHGISRTTAELEDLARFFESLRLDAHFICNINPFEPEPRQQPNLDGHRYSASQLSTYLMCPRRFFFEKILRISPELPEIFGLGQLIHVVLEQFHRNAKNFNAEPEALRLELIETFETVWSRGPGTDRGVERKGLQFLFPTLLQRATIARRAREILNRYLTTELVETVEREILACEKQIEFFVGRYPFVARIDRIDVSSEGHHIVDYKTSGNGPKRARTIKKQFLNLDAKDNYTPQDFQLPLYLIAGRTCGYNPVELTYYWLGQKDAAGKFKKSSLCVGDSSSDCLSTAEVQTVEGSVIEVIEQIVSGDFQPHPKSDFECSRCIFHQLCDVEKADRDSNDG